MDLSFLHQKRVLVFLTRKNKQQEGILKNVLSNLQLDATYLHNSQEALAAIHPDKFDFYISSLRLVDNENQQFIQKLKEIHPNWHEISLGVEDILSGDEKRMARADTEDIKKNFGS
jgi:DNA-binding NtrC family response regulator